MTPTARAEQAARAQRRRYGRCEECGRNDPSFAVQVEAGATERTLYLACPDGPWVQFTYGGLRTQDGAVFAGLGYGMDDLARTPDGHAWTDVVIAFVDEADVPEEHR